MNNRLASPPFFKIAQQQLEWRYVVDIVIETKRVQPCVKAFFDEALG